jgi:hypothetical protein
MFLDYCEAVRSKDVDYLSSNFGSFYISAGKRKEWHLLVS